MTKRVSLSLTWVFAVGLLALTWQCQICAEPTSELIRALPNLCDFEMHRITSADPTEGNEDWRELPPSKTLVVANVRGPGCIVHFRDNITCNEPHHLQKHVLRMFWDDEETPSVEVPFKEWMRFLIEHGGGVPPFKSSNYYYSLAYWYQTEPHAPFPKLPSVAKRISWDEPGKRDK